AGGVVPFADAAARHFLALGQHRVLQVNDYRIRAGRDCFREHLRAVARNVEIGSRRSHHGASTVILASPTMMPPWSGCTNTGLMSIDEMRFTFSARSPMVTAASARPSRS